MSVRRQQNGIEPSSESQGSPYVVGGQGKKTNKKKWIAKERHTKKSQEEHKRRGRRPGQHKKSRNRGKGLQGLKLVSNKKPLGIIRKALILFLDSIGLKRGIVMRPKQRQHLRKEQQRQMNKQHKILPKIQWDDQHKWDKKQEQEKVKHIANKFRQHYSELNYPTESYISFFLDLSAIFSRQATQELYQILMQIYTIFISQPQEIDKQISQIQSNKIQQFVEMIVDCDPVLVQAQLQLQRMDGIQHQHHQKFVKFPYCFFNRKFSNLKEWSLQIGKEVIKRHLKILLISIYQGIRVHHTIQKLSAQNVQVEGSENVSDDQNRIKSYNFEYKQNNLDRSQIDNGKSSKSFKKISYKFKVIGMMSGTSLDGVDLSYCQYFKDLQSVNQKWRYRLIAAKTYPYPQQILQVIKRISNPHVQYLHFIEAERVYSIHIARVIQSFIHQQIQSIPKEQTNIDFVCIHGHTIFHQPDKGLTVQITNLNLIAGLLEIDIIGNFRQLDVHRGGNGAPLAPFGQELFQNLSIQNQNSKVETIYLNLGGIANIGFNTYDDKGKRINYGTDIAFCNIVLNHFSKVVNGDPFDKSGQLGRSGKFEVTYFQRLCQIFPSQKYPICLAREQIQKFLDQITLMKNQVALTQFLSVVNTYYEFLADRIAECICLWAYYKLSSSQDVRILCTGGGTYNTYLLQNIKNKINLNNYNLKTNIKVDVPSKNVIQFKESIIFGLLGVKSYLGQQNCSRGVGGMMVKGKRENITQLNNIANQKAVIKDQIKIYPISHNLSQNRIDPSSKPVPNWSDYIQKSQCKEQVHQQIHQKANQMQEQKNICPEDRQDDSNKLSKLDFAQCCRIIRINRDPEQILKSQEYQTPKNFIEIDMSNWE